MASFRSLFAQRDTNSHPAEGGSPRTSKPKSIGFGKRKNRFRDPNDLSGILADDDDDNNNNNTQVDLEDRDSRDRITDMSHAQTANSEETIRVKKEISQVYETV